MSDRNAIPSFPARLYELRTRAGLTQEQLAARAGTAVVSLSKMERGERFPSLELAGRLAKALGCKVDDLLKPASVKRLRPTKGRPKNISEKSRK